MNGNSIQYIVNTIASGNERPHLLRTHPDKSMVAVKKKQAHNNALEKAGPELAKIGKHIWNIRTLGKMNIIRCILDKNVLRWIVYSDRLMKYIKKVFKDSNLALLNDPQYDEIIRTGLTNIVSQSFLNVTQYKGIPIEGHTVMYPNLLIMGIDVWVSERRETFTPPSPLVAFANVVIPPRIDFPKYVTAYIVKKDLEYTLTVLYKHSASQAGVFSAFRELKPRMNTRFKELVYLGYLLWGYERIVLSRASPLQPKRTEPEFNARSL